MRSLKVPANNLARGLLSGSVEMVGVVVPDLHDEFCGDIVTGIEERLSYLGVHMMCVLGHNDRESETRVVSELIRRDLKGLIVLADHLPDRYLTTIARERALVVLNRAASGPGWQSLRIDNISGGKMATRHLISMGHTRIAHLTGPSYREDVEDRKNGYLEALADAGIEPDPSLMVFTDRTWDEVDGASATEQILRGTDATAIFAGNDFLAIGALEELRRQHISVPKGMSVVSYDNRSYTRWTNPPLTCIDYPKKEIGRRAADYVVDLMRGGTPAPLPMLTPNLIVRESTSSPGIRR